MSFPTAQATFLGRPLMRASYSGARGITPCVALVDAPPQDRPTAGVGPLSLTCGGTVTLPDMAVQSAVLRNIGHDEAPRWRWSVHLLDHRWRWQFGSISFDWNRRLPDGKVDPATRKTPQEMATELLLAMGEVGFDVSRMPQNVYPRMVGTTVPARALSWLCDYVGCEITGGEFASVVIHRIGVGNELPSGGTERHTQVRMTPDVRPSKLVLQGGPTVYQSKLKLSAIGREQSGETKLVDEVSYKPTGWSTQSPFSFPGVAGADRPPAFETIWRWFRVTGQADGSLAVPGCPETVTKLEQLFPLGTHLLEYGRDLDDVDRVLPAYLEGVYWPYGDLPENSEDFTRWIGGFQLAADRGVVSLPYPVFKLSSIGTFEEPELYLTTTYNVRSEDGTRFDGLRRERTIGGSGGEFVIARPELFASVKADYDGGTSPSGLTTTTADAIEEADAYLDLFEQRFAEAETSEMEYAGIVPIALDGAIQQVRYQVGVKDQPLTRASRNFEFDVHAPSAAQRKRAESHESIRETLRV